MERWLNQEMQKLSEKNSNCTVANPYKGTGFVKKKEKDYRNSFRTSENHLRIKSIADAVEKEIKS